MNFKNILEIAMEDYGVGVRKFEEILIENGITDINFRRISDYKNGNHTPTYDRAKQMLNVLEYDISEEELLDALKENRENIKEQEEYLNSESKEIRRTIRIKLKRLIPGVEPEEAERFLTERIEELFGEGNQISNYIQSLISKDLRQYVIDKEDVSIDEN